MDGPARPSFVVEGCSAVKREWRGSAALAVGLVSRRLAMYPYARGEWQSGIEDTLAAACEGVEVGGRIAVFSEGSMAQPLEPTAMPMYTAMERVGIEPRCEISWLDLGRAVGLPEGVQAWRSPHNPPSNCLQMVIAIGQVGSRAREPGPFERAEMGLSHKCTLSAREWERDIWNHWIAEMQPCWIDGGLPYEAVRRLVGLHTYEGETVLVLGASVSAAMAALDIGRGCLIAAGSESGGERVAEELAALDGDGAPR